MGLYHCCVRCVRLGVRLLPLLGPDLGLDVLHRPAVPLLLGTHHPEAGLDILSLPRGVQGRVLAYQVFILVFIVCLWCNLSQKIVLMAKLFLENSLY